MARATAPPSSNLTNVSVLSCEVWAALWWALQIFWLMMLAYALVSWVPSLQGRWSMYVARIVEPVLVPIRQVIPPVGGIDLSFIVVILLIAVVKGAIPGHGSFSYCSLL